MSDQSEFFYQRVQWKHDLDDQPVVPWAEISSDGFERRKVDEFADGTFGFAINEGRKRRNPLGNCSDACTRTDQCSARVRSG